MTVSILNLEGTIFLSRWIHFMSGVTWIGLLYYFNFVQGAFFNEIDAATKGICVRKLVPKALWWFRWAAMFTLITGLYTLTTRAHLGGWEIFSTSWGVTILTGSALAVLMWANVWFVIWPSQKVVIHSAEEVAAGRSALPEAAERGARAGIASRHNVLFSIPMLFFMGAASHLPLQIGPEPRFGTLTIILAALFGLIQLNALKGKLGPLSTVKGTITSGIIFTVVLYVLLECFTK